MPFCDRKIRPDFVYKSLVIQSRKTEDELRKINQTFPGGDKEYFQASMGGLWETASSGDPYALGNVLTSLKEQNLITTPRKVLILGTGDTGNELLKTQNIFPEAEVHCIDPNEEWLQAVDDSLNGSNKQFFAHIGTVFDLPFNEAEINLIIHSRVFDSDDFTPEMKLKALEEIFRVLRPNSLEISNIFHLPHDKKIWKEINCPQIMNQEFRAFQKASTS